jgi:hypothetical protein
MRAQSITVAVAGALALTVAPVSAQAPADSLTADSTITAALGARYHKGGLHNFFFGDHYRDLWATPIKVPVLDLKHFAGGLRPTRRGGGTQTKSLRLESADGRKWAFRSIDKDPSPLLPPDLRETVADRIYQDQISAGAPAGPLVVSPLLQAVGVKAAAPQIFVMPHDPALGEFKDLGGVIGTLEERPTSGDDEGLGFQGAVKVADTDELFEKLDKDPRETIDTAAYLKARLMDVLLGDWDRHGKQWRWIKSKEGKEAPWEPVPYDRDQAFVRYDGLLLSIARASGFPQLVDFGDKYSSTMGINWNARFLDRRLLVGLPQAVWDSTARELQSRLTDQVIDDAVHRLPPEYFQKDGQRLATALKKRRDALPDEANKLYRFFARNVEVRTTKRDEVAVAHRNGDGTMDLTIRQADSEKGDTSPFFYRRFIGGETQDVRLYLNEGRDSVHLEGDGGGPTLRVIGSPTAGGDGPKIVVDDATGGSTKVFDTSPKSVVAGSHRPSIDRRPYSPPDSLDPIRRAPRDWGHQWRFNPWMGYSSDLGFFIGGGPTLYDYGFRQNPYASKVSLRAGYATGADAFRADFLGDFRFQNSGMRLLVKARASGIDVLRFFDFGNETPDLGSSDFSKVFQQQYFFSIGPAWQVGRYTTIWFAPIVRYADTDLDRDVLIAQVRPYGSEKFGEVGAQGGFEFDSRDHRAAATRGVLLVAAGSVYPNIWDAVSTYGEVHGAASTYLTANIPLQPTLALRAGGQKNWGTYPYFDAAYVGGANTVRGLFEHRYIGDASAWGNAELRLRISRYYIILPGEWGLFGAADGGRVWFNGESSSKWHHGFGGGLWFAPLTRNNALTAAVVESEGRTGVYIKAGFMF